MDWTTNFGQKPVERKQVVRKLGTRTHKNVYYPLFALIFNMPLFASEYDIPEKMIFK